MRFLSILAVFAAVLGAQAPKLPPDIDAQSFSRLPLLKHEEAKGETLRVWDVIAKDKATPPMGPLATSLYSPGVAEPMDKLNQYLRNTVVGPAAFQICAILAARAYDDNYEW